MPYPRTGAGYPDEFFRLIEDCSLGAHIRYECETAKQARGVKGRWYQFVAALKRDADLVPAWVDKKAAIETALRAMSVECKPDEQNDCVLHFLKKDTIKQIVKITVEFPEAVAAPLSTKESESLARLVGKLEGEEK